jgi:hypothetical protein
VSAGFLEGKPPCSIVLRNRLPRKELRRLLSPRKAVSPTGFEPQRFPHRWRSARNGSSLHFRIRTLSFVIASCTHHVQPARPHSPPRHLLCLRHLRVASPTDIRRLRQHCAEIRYEELQAFLGSSPFSRTRWRTFGRNTSFSRGRSPQQPLNSADRSPPGHARRLSENLGLGNDKSAARDQCLSSAE